MENNTLIIKRAIEVKPQIEEVEITLPAFFTQNEGLHFTAIYSKDKSLMVSTGDWLPRIAVGIPDITIGMTPCTEEEFAAAYYKASAALAKAYDTALGVELPEQLKAA